MIGKNKQGIYYFSIYYKDSQGVRKQKKVENKEWKTKKEVQRQLDLFLISLNGKTEKVTVGHLFELFIEHKKDKLKLKSIYSMKNVYKLHIKPIFENRVVDSLTNSDIIKWQRGLLNDGYRNKYLEMIQQLFRSALIYGVKYDYIEKNPFKIDSLRNRDEVKEEMLYWTIEEFKKFIGYVDEPIFSAYFKMLYWCGLREGEAVSLLKSDIDFIKGTVSVSKTYDFIHNIVTTPKTNTSYRTIALPDVVLRALDELMLEYQQIDGYNENVILFGFNKYIKPNTIKRRQLEACKLSKVKVIRIHDLRHSHVSMLINYGFSAFEIAKRLGHSVDMVNEVYGHLFPERDRVLVDRLNQAYTENQSKTLKN